MKLGAKMIRELSLKSFFQGSSGIYIDPLSGMESHFKLWVTGSNQLKLSVIQKINGREMVMKEEKWFKV